MREEMNNKFTEFFPIGVRYGTHRESVADEKNWDFDFENMKNCGIDCVRIHAYWSMMEPKEGEYNFEYCDRIVEKAEKYGIKVLFTLYHIAAPEWAFRKHPESRYVSANGTVWNSTQHVDTCQGGWPGLSLDGNAVKETLEHSIREFVLHYKNNDTVVAIDIWHEPAEEAAQRTNIDWRDAMFNYSVASIAEFRKWLKNKYKTLEGLKKAWTRYYQNWDEVDAPRDGGNFTEWLDWKAYRMDALTENAKWIEETIRKYDDQRVTLLHSGIFELGHPITHSDDHFRMANVPDVYGCSLYDTLHEEIGGFTCELMRSTVKNKGYIIGETGTGGGPLFPMIGTEPEAYYSYARAMSPEEIFNLEWSNIARGAKGIMFWSWRPELGTTEVAGLGFTERNGMLTERTDFLKKFTDIIRENRKDLAESFAPKSDVAIIMNIDSMILEGIVSVIATASGVLDTGNCYYKDMQSLMGCYKLCMKNGIQPDIVSKDEVENGKLSAYKLALFPYSISIGKKMAKAVSDYVENGGNVISDAMLGYFTDEGWGAENCPSNGLDKTFGFWVSDHYEEIHDCDIIFSNNQDKIFEHVGRHLKERLVVDETTKVIGTFKDGRPAVTVNDFGKGKAVYVATMFFLNTVKSGLDKTNDLFNQLLLAAGYQKDKRIDGPEVSEVVEVRRLTGKNCEFVFIINHTSCRQVIEAETVVNIDGTFSEIVNGEESGKTTDGQLTIRTELDPLEVKIYKIQNENNR